MVNTALARKARVLFGGRDEHTPDSTFAPTWNRGSEKLHPGILEGREAKEVQEDIEYIE